MTDKPNLRSAAGLSLLRKTLDGKTLLSESEKQAARKMAEQAVKSEPAKPQPK